MARNFRVLLGTIGDVPVANWSVSFPAPVSNANAAQIAASLNGGGLAQTVVAGGFANFVDMWVLTGGNPQDGTYAFNNLPAGFTVASQSLIASILAAIGPGGSYDITLSALGSGGSNTLTTAGAGLLTFTYGSLQTAFQLGTEKLGVIIGADVNTIINVLSLTLTGTYTLFAFTWTVDTSNPVRNDEPVQISSDPLDPDPLQLDELDEVNIQYVDLDGDPQTVIITPTTQTANLYIFLMPLLPGVDASQPITLNAVGNGTQFSGSVMLGTLEILIENGSGIYRIVPGKTNDTLYINSAVDDTTADVKIPNPFAKTGFIGG